MSRTVGAKNKDQTNTKSALKSIVRELNEKIVQLEGEAEINSALVLSVQESRDFFKSQLEIKNNIITEIKAELSRKKNEIYLSENLIGTKDKSIYNLKKVVKFLSFVSAFLFINSAAIWFLK